MKRASGASGAQQSSRRPHDQRVIEHARSRRRAVGRVVAYAGRRPLSSRRVRYYRCMTPDKDGAMIEPASEMLFDDYVQHVTATRSAWSQEAP